MWLKSCRLESCCWENNCLDRCLILAHFGGVFGSGGLDLECDGASIGNDDDSLRKLETKVTLATVVPALAVLLKQVALKASKKPEDSVISIALGGYDGFDGVDGGFDGFDGFDGFNGNGGFDGVEGDSDGFVGLGGTKDVDGSGFAGLGVLKDLGDRSE